MLESVWKSLSEASGKRWVVSSLMPAFLFWIIYGLTYILWWGLPQTLAWWNNETDVVRALILVVVPILIILTAFALDVLGLSLLQWAEGYWDGIPMVGKPLRKIITQVHIGHTAKLRARRTALFWKEYARDYPPISFPEVWTGREPPDPISPEEIPELLILDKELHDIPSHGTDLPTRLGNLLRSAEQHPLRYGLDPVVVFPRLYFLLPNTIQSELDDARSHLDACVRSIFLAIVFTIVWGLMATIFPSSVTIVAAVIGALGVWNSQNITLRAASIYGELLRTVFDLYRFDLYEALHLPVPENSNTEAEAGKNLTAFLWRGPSVFNPEGINWTSTSAKP